MKFLFAAFAMVFAVQFFFAVPVTLAAESGGGSAVPGLVQLSGCEGWNCTACNLVDLANGIIKWLIGIVFLVFAVLVAVAGVRMVLSGGSHHALDEAKGMFVNAIIGLVIILAAWLIVDSIMRVLLPNGQLNYGSVTGWLYWSEVQCQEVHKPEYDPSDTLKLTYVEVQNQITTSLSGVGSWTAGSNGIPLSACSINGYSGGTPTYDCSAQIAQCEQNGGGSPVLTNNDQSVSCVPDADATINTGGGASCSGISPSDLKTIPGTSFQARISIVDSFVRMRSAAAAAGITLIVTSAYRSDAKQVEIWNSHHCDTVAGHCSGYVAKPCSLGGNGSNHSQGNALDISGSSMGSPIYNWLKANGSRFGFYNNLGSIDPVHWSLSGR